MGVWHNGSVDVQPTPTGKRGGPVVRIPSPNPGDRFGQWTVQQYLGRVNGLRTVAVRCDCGTTANHYLYNLTGGQTTRCKACFYSNRKRTRRDLVDGKPVTKTWVVDGDHLDALDRVVKVRCTGCGRVKLSTRKQVFAAKLGRCECQPKQEQKRSPRSSATTAELMPDGRRAVDVAAEHGVSKGTYRTRRTRYGWSIGLAATTPVLGRETADA
jgi:hypothetical protein